jgi:hypothetical protein
MYLNAGSQDAGVVNVCAIELSVEGLLLVKKVSDIDDNV